MHLNKQVSMQLKSEQNSMIVSSFFTLKFHKICLITFTFSLTFFLTYLWYIYIYKAEDSKLNLCTLNFLWFPKYFWNSLIFLAGKNNFHFPRFFHKFPDFRNAAYRYAKKYSLHKPSTFLWTFGGIKC